MCNLHRPCFRGWVTQVLGFNQILHRCCPHLVLCHNALHHSHCPPHPTLLHRSIGDDMASSIGCTAEPEVIFLRLQPLVDASLIMATDGIWDVLSNDEV